MFYFPWRTSVRVRVMHAHAMSARAALHAVDWAQTCVHGRLHPASPPAAQPGSGSAPCTHSAAC
eukprot:256096-Chlamydomonas_euryale.AAC.5